MEQRTDEGTHERGESLSVVGRAVPTTSVRSFLAAIERPRVAWSTGDATIVGGGTALALTAAGADRFDAIRRAATDVFDRLDGPTDVPPAARPRLFGGFAFHEDHDRPETGPWRGYPGGRFVLPAIQLTATANGTWLTAAETGPNATATAVARLDDWTDRLGALPTVAEAAPPGIAAREPTPDRSGWRSQVRTALNQIDRGDLRKVVLAQSLAVDLERELSVPDALARLGGTYPDCVRFLVEPHGAGTFFGATPEELVTLEDRSVRTTVLAGSTGRGDTTDEDAWLADELRDSAKDVHEHELVLEAVRDQLAPMAASVDAGDREVRQLATVQHLETPVQAQLDRDRHVLELVEALHPTPAVGGMPQDAALETIRKHEAFERGWYAAPVGWIDAAGNGRFAVAIRSAIARDRRATLFAGAGIVADSDPEREWGELQLKYRPVLDELE